MKSSVPEKPEASWLIQRILLARLGDLDEADVTREARARLAQLRSQELTDAEFTSLLDSEHARLGSIGADNFDRGWPTPIALALARMIEEPIGQWDRLVSRMRDAFEVLVKYLAAIAISDLLEQSPFPESMRSLLVRDFEVPRLGHWVGFLRESIGALSKVNRPLFVPELARYHKKFLAPNVDNFLMMRNEWAHSGTQQQELCAETFATRFPRFMLLFAEARFLKRYNLVGIYGGKSARGRGCEPVAIEEPTAGAEPDGTVGLQSPQRSKPLRLSPILVYRFCLAQSSRGSLCAQRLFLFYNDRAKNWKITLLDYPFGHLSRDAEAFADFVRRIPLDEWKREETDRFGSLIDEKTREFVGRCDEVAQVKRWVEDRSCGFYVVWGSPGVGKSALMSALSRVGSDAGDATFEDPELTALLQRAAWPKLAVIHYFIVRGEITTKPTEFLATLLRSLDQRFELRCSLTGSADELARELQHQLQAVSKILRERKSKLLVLLDGLDESISAEGEAFLGDSLLAFIPKDLPPGIFLVLCGRRRKEIQDLCGALHREKVSVIDLQGLNEDDVRAMLHRAVSKYELDPAYVAEVTNFSQGNPLYVKLLMEALIEGQLRINDISALPNSLRELYRNIVDRLVASDPEGLSRLLITLALAREQLTAEQIGGMTGQSLAEARRSLEECVEVLTERRSADGRAIYRLFHDSFADYLRSHPDYGGLVPEVSKRILMFATRPNASPQPEAEIARTIERLVDGQDLDAASAAHLSVVIERASHLLTSHNLLLQNLVRRPIEQLSPLLLALGRCLGPATARMTVQCLVAAATQDPNAVSRIAAGLVEPPKRWSDATLAQSNRQAARIALEVGVAACHMDSMTESIKETLLLCCRSADSNVRSLAIVSVFRIMHSNYSLGSAVLGELARRCVRYGVISPRGLEAFIGCALGLFFERTHDAQLVRDLKQMVTGMAARILGLRIALWFFPRAVPVLWAAVPDDYNSINLMELKAYKNYAAAHPEIVEQVNRMIDFIDPAHGTSAEFSQALDRFEHDLRVTEASLGLFPSQAALISRALAGDESALEAVYESSQRLPADHGARHDFMFRMRIVQVGRRLLSQPPLGGLWVSRMEVAIREFMYTQRGCYRSLHHVYTVGALIPGFVFLAHQQGHGRLPLLAELIDWASAGEEGMLRWPETPCERQPDALLMRLLEVVGVEYGLFDPLSREVVFFGISHFLGHATKFDEFLWNRLATILVRMSVYQTDAVSHFLGDLPSEHREVLQARLNQILPEESVGSLISQHRSEMFYASVLAESSENPGGLRTEWQDFLRVFVGPKSLSATLRYAAKKILQLTRQTGSAQPPAGTKIQ